MIKKLFILIFILFNLTNTNIKAQKENFNMICLPGVYLVDPKTKPLIFSFNTYNMIPKFYFDTSIGVLKDSFFIKPNLLEQYPDHNIFRIGFGSNTTISDKNGEMILYLCERTIFNKFNRNLLNGKYINDYPLYETINGMGGIFFHFNNNDSIYYLISARNLYKINVSSSHNFGEIIKKTILPFQPITVVLNKNNTGLWLINYNKQESKLLAYLLNDSGKIDNSPVISLIP